jgi:NAD(P)H-dependent FMN reductase
MNKKILVIVGHPRRDSYCGALARAYAEAARESNTEVKELYVGEWR